MEMTINLDVVLAVISIIGAVIAVIIACGKVMTKFALMQSTLTAINKEVVEIKALMSGYETEINALKIKVATIEASSKSAHHRLNDIPGIPIVDLDELFGKERDDGTTQKDN